MNCKHNIPYATQKVNSDSRNREEKTSFLWGLKSQVGCNNCKNKDFRVLEFHHINPKIKKFRLDLSCVLRSWNSIIKEIKKCEILCANCHRIKEFERKQKEAKERGLVY